METFWEGNPFKYAFAALFCLCAIIYSAPITFDSLSHHSLMGTAENVVCCPRDRLNLVRVDFFQII